MNVADAIRDAHDKVMKAAGNRGTVLGTGFAAYAIVVLAGEAASDDDIAKVNEHRIAYYAGAQHLFAALMTIMDADREPTEGDMARMSLINDELERFAEEMKLLVLPTGGNA
jgi:predicted component of type VI protein secretion system